MKTEELQVRINNTVRINSKNGIYKSLKKLEARDCKIGDIVLTKSGSVFEIQEIKQNANRSEDLTIAVGKGEYIGCMYGSYNGVFPSIHEMKQV